MLLLSLSVVVLVLPAEAGITNDGNYAVQVEIKRNKGTSRKSHIYPGQTISMPDDATAVHIPGGSFKGHGDETILLTIVESNGTVGTITALGGTYKLNQDGTEEAEAAEMILGSVKNTGNIYVTIQVTKENGKTSKQRLYPEDEYILPKDVAKVEVLKDRSLRGDEIIEVEVALPDETTSTITALGGVFEIAKEEVITF